MKTIRLGRTGLEVSRMGIGGIAIQRPSMEESVRVMRRAFDLGVTFIDTAHGYGDSEVRVGKAVAGRRRSVVIATKGGGDKKQTLANIDESLSRMGTDYIDIWQFHGINTPGYLQSILGPGGGLEGAKAALKAGKILHIGFSSHSLDVSRDAVKSDEFETVQYPLNFVTDEAVESLLPLAREHDLGFIAMKPFAGGNIREAELAVKYLLRFEDVLPDPGVETADQIEQIVRIVERGSADLSPAELSRMEEIRGILGKKFCHQCGYCLPCPNGVNIPMAMIVGIMWREWPERLFRNPSWWYSPMALSGRKCTACGACEKKCPYTLDIRETVKENMAFFEKTILGER